LAGKTLANRPISELRDVLSHPSAKSTGKDEAPSSLAGKGCATCHLLTRGSIHNHNRIQPTGSNVSGNSAFRGDSGANGKASSAVRLSEWSLLAFAVIALSAGAQTTAPNEWAWMGGSSVLTDCGNMFCYPPGVYGTLGTPTPGNIPSGLVLATSWTDSRGRLWLFGGQGIGADGVIGDLNSLWKFDPSSNEWAWMDGSDTSSQPGVYGILGTPAAGNTPGSRDSGTGWTDNSGHLWLFGGVGYDSSSLLGYLNDLWEFDPSANEWAWMGGNNTLPNKSGYGGQPGIYGTLGTPAAGNVAGGRSDASGWTDSDGHLWLFGGVGYDSSGTLGYLNDLWGFNPSTNQWVWVGGSSSMNCGAGGCGQSGVYGTLGKPAAGNTPGGRNNASRWTDNSGNFWLFGGGGENDLWELIPSINEWAWMGGSSTVGSSGGQVGVYGALGTPAAGNTPGSRYGAANWTDSRGDLWLYGGEGYDSNGSSGSLNDFWKYQPHANAATPTFSVGSGTYTTAQTVTISDGTTGSTIYYTTNGTTPTTSSPVYSGPVIVLSSETVEAIATASGYVASPVATATYTIPPDFAIAINPASVSVQAGQSGTTTITVQDEGGFNGNVAFACSGLPAGDTCSFSMLTVPTPAGVTYSTLTVNTSANSAAIQRNSGPLFPESALAVAFCFLGWKKRRRWQMLVLLAASAVGLSLLGGCSGGSNSGGGGGGGGTQPVTTTVTVTATSGALSHTTTFSLTVN